jgi:hypothetical protein
MAPRPGVDAPTQAMLIGVALVEIERHVLAVSAFRLAQYVHGTTRLIASGRSFAINDLRLNRTFAVGRKRRTYQSRPAP